MLMEIRSCRGQSTHPEKSDHKLGWMSTGWRILRLTSVSHEVPASLNWPALLENLCHQKSQAVNQWPQCIVGWFVGNLMAEDTLSGLSVTQLRVLCTLLQNCLPVNYYTRLDRRLERVLLKSSWMDVIIPLRRR